MLNNIIESKPVIFQTNPVNPHTTMPIKKTGKTPSNEPAMPAKTATTIIKTPIISSIVWFRCSMIAKWFAWWNSLGLFGMCGLYQKGEKISIHLFDTCFPVIICQLEVLLNRENSNGKFQSKSNKVDRLYKRKLY